jgi:hypothetical protein
MERRGDAERKLLKGCLLPAWGGRPVSSITRRDIIALVEKIAERGAGIQANRPSRSSPTSSRSPPTAKSSWPII